MANNELNLLSCPFCGGVAKLEDHRLCWSVSCTVCDATVIGTRAPEPDGSESIPFWAGIQQTAIDAWNRRSAPAQAEPSDALAVICDLDAISMALGARLAQMSATSIKHRDYLNRDDVMHELMEWRCQWDKNSAARPDFAAVARGQQGGVSDAWQPIETAPKDGTNVLLFLGSPWNSVETAYWFPLWENWQHSDDRPDHVRDEYCGIGSNVPTHWQPLPPPPAIQAQAGDAPMGGA